MVHFNYVINGIKRYIEKEIYPRMESMQRVAARFAVARMSSNPDTLLKVMQDSGIIKSLNIVDDEGYVDIDGIREDLRREIQAEEKLIIDGAMFGKLGDFVLGKITLTPRDVDTIYGCIMEGVRNEDN